MQIENRSDLPISEGVWFYAHKKTGTAPSVPILVPLNKKDALELTE